MNIPVVFRDGQELNVSQDEFQFLMVTRRIMFFQRSDGWVVIGRDKMRGTRSPYHGEERRKHPVYAKKHWY